MRVRLASLLLASALSAGCTDFTGARTFRAAARYLAGLQPFGLVTADFNRDGTPDLAVVDSSGNAIDLLVFSGCR